MEILGYICSLLIGLSLGLLGAGGSILTLPVLVYLFRIEPMQAIKYSLFIVGVSSIGSIYPKFRKKEVLVIEGLCFALISCLNWL
ncbi:MAG: hypothetical protein EOO88_51395 [Pedobacter sp.]|nr:MAG: hypothetical protein EOO88_51395 [Pedobacter sp.]